MWIPVMKPTITKQEIYKKIGCIKDRSSVSKLHDNEILAAEVNFWKYSSTVISLTII